jgi:hypothetical protein
MISSVSFDIFGSIFFIDNNFFIIHVELTILIIVDRMQLCFSFKNLIMNVLELGMREPYICPEQPSPIYFSVMFCFFINIYF